MTGGYQTDICIISSIFDGELVWGCSKSNEGERRVDAVAGESQHSWGQDGHRPGHPSTHQHILGLKVASLFTFQPSNYSQICLKYSLRGRNETSTSKVQKTWNETVPMPTSPDVKLPVVIVLVSSSIDREWIEMVMIDLLWDTQNDESCLNICIMRTSVCTHFKSSRQEFICDWSEWEVDISDEKDARTDWEGGGVLTPVARQNKCESLWNNNKTHIGMF